MQPEGKPGKTTTGSVRCPISGGSRRMGKKASKEPDGLEFKVNCSGTRLAVSGEPEGHTGLGEILPSAAYMARLAVAVA